MCEQNDGHVIGTGGRIVAEHLLDPDAADFALVVRIRHSVDVEERIDEGRILHDMRSGQNAITRDDGSAAKEAVGGRWTVGRHSEQSARVQGIDDRSCSADEVRFNGIISLCRCESRIQLRLNILDWLLV